MKPIGLLLIIVVYVACGKKAEPTYGVEERTRRIVEQQPISCSMKEGPCVGFGASNACATDRDCDGDEESCVSPLDDNCGQLRDGDCYMRSGRGCDEGEVCLQLTGGCVSGDAGRCIPDCRIYGCGATEQCLKRSGYCEPIPCDEEGAAACGPMLTCADGNGPELAGCDRLSCRGDADCPTRGACWNHRCYEKPAVCEPPAP